MNLKINKKLLVIVKTITFFMHKFYFITNSKNRGIYEENMVFDIWFNCANNTGFLWPH